MPDDLREQMIDAALSEFGGEWWSSDDRLAAEYMVDAILALPEIAAGLALRSLVVGQGLSVGMGAHERAARVGEVDVLAEVLPLAASRSSRCGEGDAGTSRRRSPPSRRRRAMPKPDDGFTFCLHVGDQVTPTDIYMLVEAARRWTQAAEERDRYRGALERIAWPHRLSHREIASIARAALGGDDG